MVERGGVHDDDLRVGGAVHAQDAENGERGSTHRPRIWAPGGPFAPQKVLHGWLLENPTDVRRGKRRGQKVMMEVRWKLRHAAACRDFRQPQFSEFLSCALSELTEEEDAGIHTLKFFYIPLTAL